MSITAMSQPIQKAKHRPVHSYFNIVIPDTLRYRLIEATSVEDLHTLSEIRAALQLQLNERVKEHRPQNSLWRIEDDATWVFGDDDLYHHLDGGMHIIGWDNAVPDVKLYPQEGEKS